MRRENNNPQIAALIKPILAFFMGTTLGIQSTRSARAFQQLADINLTGTVVLTTYMLGRCTVNENEARLTSPSTLTYSLGYGIGTAIGFSYGLGSNRTNDISDDGLCPLEQNTCPANSFG